MTKELKDLDHIWEILNGEEEGIFQLKGKHVPILREILLDDQNGLCPTCKKIAEGPCLDHSHTKKVGGSGLVRGVLCRSCNVFLGKMENNCKRYGIDPNKLSEVLQLFKEYLEQEHLPFMHPSEATKAPILKKASWNKLYKLYSGRAKFPEYRTNPKGKPIQKMTVKLQKLFDEYGIEPEFYGGGSEKEG